jgi:uncharacterized membrane protein YeaQ/YmgE (transglycosylase-associated protein family)
MVKPGRQNLGLPATLLLGPARSIIGGAVANLLGTGNIFEPNVLGFIVAVIAAVLLFGAAEGIAGSRKTLRWPAPVLQAGTGAADPSWRQDPGDARTSGCRRTGRAGALRGRFGRPAAPTAGHPLPDACGNR